MPEAVIVATARSPIGRAFKGSLVSLRPDEMAAQMVIAVLDKLPELDRDTIEDLILGCAQPAGEAGYNAARVVGLLAGLVFNWAAGDQRLERGARLLYLSVNGLALLTLATIYGLNLRFSRAYVPAVAVG